MTHADMLGRVLILVERPRPPDPWTWFALGLVVGFVIDWLARTL